MDTECQQTQAVQREVGLILRQTVAERVRWMSLRSSAQKNGTVDDILSPDLPPHHQTAKSPAGWRGFLMMALEPRRLHREVRWVPIKKTGVSRSFSLS